VEQAIPVKDRADKTAIDHFRTPQTTGKISAPQPLPQDKTDDGIVAVVDEEQTCPRRWLTGAMAPQGLASLAAAGRWLARAAGTGSGGTAPALGLRVMDFEAAV
jgi:hypothetical protein